MEGQALQENGGQGCKYFLLTFFGIRILPLPTITSSLTADRFLKQRSGCPPSSQVFFTRPGFEFGFSLMGKNPADRVKTLLGKLKSMRRSIERGYNVSEELRHTSHKFVRRVENIFANLPKPLEWLSFLNHDLPIFIDFCEEVQEVSIQHRHWPRPAL